MKKVFLVFFASILLGLGGNINAQCTDLIVHLSGTQVINGVAVSVTSAGSVDSWSSCNGLGPYWVGQDDQDGSYTFHFDPPIIGVTLGYADINASSGAAGGIEEIRHYINGGHHPLTSVGDSTGCHSPATLTANNDLSGVSPNTVYGSRNLSIMKVIDSITILNKVLAGNPWGTSFSIAFCKDIGTSVTENPSFELAVYPNPSKGKITVDLSHPKSESNDLEVYNAFGQLVYAVPINSTSTEVDLSAYSKGIYLFRIKNDKGASLLKKVILI